MNVTVRIERFPLKKAFAISRGSRTMAEVVVVEITDGSARGWAECTPYGHYGETADGVVETIRSFAPAIEDGMTRNALRSAVPAGAARNALDCALWDLEAKRVGSRVWQLARLPEPLPVETVYTLSLAEPAAMEAAARTAIATGRTLLKVKLGSGDGGDADRMRAVRRGAPGARLLVDANEGWRPDEIDRYLAAARAVDVLMVEQPLPADKDEALNGLKGKAGVLFGADESVHVADDIERLAERYDVMNLKLDKAGGLTEAFAFVTEAERCGVTLMVGCMMATSLAMAPALLPAQRARFIDLDGPLWIATDRMPGLYHDGQIVHPPSDALWG